MAPPLNRQVVSLPFTQGVDSKTDPYLSAKPSRVENLVVRGGTLEERPGTRTLPATVDTGGNLSSGEAVFAFDNELVRLNNSKAYSLAPAASYWTTKTGTAPILTHTTRRLVNKSSSQHDYDHATANGVTVTAWVDSGIHVAVYDEATGATYQTGATALTSTSGRIGCRCVVLGRKVLVFFYNPNAALYVAIVDTSSPETVPSVTTLESDLTGVSSSSYSGSFDAYPVNGAYAAVAYITGAAGSEHITLIAVDGSGAVLSSPAKTDMGAVSNAGLGKNRFLHLHVDGNGVGYIINHEFSIYYMTFNTSTFATTKALTSVAGDGSSRYKVAIAEASKGVLTLFSSDIGGASFVSYGVYSAVLTSSAVTTAFAIINGTWGLALQTDGLVVNGVAAVVVCNDRGFASTVALQPTAWVIDVNGNAIGKMLPGISASLSSTVGGTRVCRPFTSSTGATSFLVPEQGKTSYTSQSGTIITTTPYGITRVDMRLSGAASVPALRLGNAVYVGGSMPRIYDGQEIVEAGHNLFPEAASPAMGAGGALSAGSYQWRIVYTWISAQGELQRSAPSIAATATATATQKATLTIPTQRLSGRDIAGISTAQIEVYRTTANGTVFYRVSSVTSPTLNDITTYAISYVDDTVTDAALVANELLYTTGGVNDSIAPPAYTLACTHKTRLMIAGLDDPYAWRSSSQTIHGELLRFNEAWGGQVPEATGPITGLASMDGNFIIFTTQAAYLVPGDGPDLLGNNNWPDPQLITSVNAGALSQASIANASDGLLFQNSRGFHLLGRDLSTQYLGADVEAYGRHTVRCATMRPDTEEVWIHADIGGDMPGQAEGMLGPMVTGNGGVCLVYNYRYNQWSVLTNYGAQDACYYQGKYTRVRSDGTIFQEQPGTWVDSGATFSTVLETPWIKPSQVVQGYSRVWRALLLGLYGSDCTLTWETAYDYSPTYSSADTVTVTTSGNFAPGGPFQERRHLRMQKCQALKFRFTVSGQSGSGRGLGFTSLDLEFGFYGKLQPLQAAKST